MDFPGPLAPRSGILSLWDGPLGEMAELFHAAFTNVATTWGTNQRAFFTPVVVNRPVTVYQMAIRINTQAGNVDVGIYDADARRVVNNGNVAMAVSGVQTFNITDTALVPGNYFLAVLCSLSTATLKGMSTGITAPVARVCGFAQQDVGANDLPSTATMVGATAAVIPQVVAAYSSGTF